MIDMGRAQAIVGIIVEDGWDAKKIVEGIPKDSSGGNGLCMLALAAIQMLPDMVAEIRGLRATLASVGGDPCGSAALDNIAHARYLDGEHGQ